MNSLAQGREDSTVVRYVISEALIDTAIDMDRRNSLLAVPNVSEAGPTYLTIRAKPTISLEDIARNMVHNGLTVATAYNIGSMANTIRVTGTYRCPKCDAVSKITAYGEVADHYSNRFEVDILRDISSRILEQVEATGCKECSEIQNRQIEKVRETADILDWYANELGLYFKLGIMLDGNALSSLVNQGATLLELKSDAGYTLSVNIRKADTVHLIYEDAHGNLLTALAIRREKLYDEEMLIKHWMNALLEMR